MLILALFSSGMGSSSLACWTVAGRERRAAVRIRISTYIGAMYVARLERSVTQDDNLPTPSKRLNGICIPTLERLIKYMGQNFLYLMEPESTTRGPRALGPVYASTAEGILERFEVGDRAKKKPWLLDN